MLTAQHLALIRGALQYLDEELGPHGEEAFAPYVTSEVSREELQALRALLDECELAYVPCDAEGTQLVETRLREAPTSDHSDWATVLIPRPQL